MTKDEALTMCLEYIETDKHERKYVRHAIKAALEQPEQEPMRVYVENFAAMSGWVKDSGEGAFNYVQRISYAQGVEDAIAHARPEQEPVGEVVDVSDNGFRCEFSQHLAVGTKLYTAPQRQWQGLTEDEKFEMAAMQYGWEDLLIAAEAALRSKNT